MSKKYQIVMPSYLKGIRYVGGGKIPCLLATYCRGIMTTFGDRPGIMETEYLDENSNKTSMKIQTKWTILKQAGN